MRSCVFLEAIMKYKSVPTGKPADLYIIGALAGGGVFMLLPYFNEKLTALYQLASVVLFGIGVYLLIRYRLTVFCYGIEAKDASVSLCSALPEELDFTVERVIGKKSVTVARLSLSALRSVESVKYGDLREYSKTASLYKYQSDMEPESGCLLLFEDGERDTAVFAVLPPELENYLREAAEQNRVAL